jgi:hypothetical protein
MQRSRQTEKQKSKETDKQTGRHIEESREGRTVGGCKLNAVGHEVDYHLDESVCDYVCCLRMFLCVKSTVYT